MDAGDGLQRFGPTADQGAAAKVAHLTAWACNPASNFNRMKEATMESNYQDPHTGSADARASAGNPSDSSQSPWNPAQPRQSSQSGGGAAASMRLAGEDADDVGRKTADSAEGYLNDFQAKAADVAQQGKAYAKDAVNAAGNKVETMKTQAADLKKRGIQLAAADPMKAVAYAAAGSAVLTALLISFTRGRR